MQRREVTDDAAVTDDGKSKAAQTIIHVEK